ncbi:hypothetical protein SAY86_010422 [Trapa natans]|uniref:Uncharacterized protein n=1 Tax=Trapa natans TaxID=22666 RepID=A0AAN7R077_TRANT|nr:hypothetical protein SAY86_010422 [Trapa natans]
MVSKNPSPGEGFYLDPNGMALPGLRPFSTAANAADSTTPSPSDDLAKKVRKPYTIKKSRESWTEPEHDKFLEALHLFDRDWKKIEAFIGSKTVIQIRSHAQKYFLKVQKNGSNEHLPPPRPKRKAAHPYPQKASKNAQVPPEVSGSLPSSSGLPKSGFVLPPGSSLILRTPVNNTKLASQTNSSVPTINLPHTKDRVNNCSSSESTQRKQAVYEPTEQGHKNLTLRVLPDFAQVYYFIGSVFDPEVTDHLQKLKKMDPIDVETVCSIMKFSSITLVYPDQLKITIMQIIYLFTGVIVDAQLVHQYY